MRTTAIRFVNFGRVDCSLEGRAPDFIGGSIAAAFMRLRIERENSAVDRTRRLRVSSGSCAPLRIV
jgi:hypothetical protein